MFNQEIEPQKSNSDLTPNESTESTFENSLELARQSFSPELQNALAALMGARDTLSIERLAIMASNADGKSFGNEVDVTPEQMTILVQLLLRAEEKYGIKLLEVGPTLDTRRDTSETKPRFPMLGGANDLVPPSTSLQKTDYKFTDRAQAVFKDKYPQLWVDFNKMYAKRLLDEWYGDRKTDSDTSKKPELAQPAFLLPEGEVLGAAINEAAQRIKELEAGRDQESPE